MRWTDGSDVASDALNDRPAQRRTNTDLREVRCSRTTDETGPVCRVHGARWTEFGCLTRRVLNDVAGHRQFQYENYGPNRDIKDGTGPEVKWIPGLDRGARAIESLFRAEWDWDVDPDPAEHTWMRMLREEVAEAFGQKDVEFLEAELIQVAALAVSWVEKLRERS